MGLTLYIGGSGAGKSCLLLNEIIRQAIEKPEKKFYVIVPEQFTMQTQKELVRLHPCHGILNIDVLSFDRLAYRVFEEVGFRKEELLEEIGKSFVLERIALDKKKELPFFGQNLVKPGNLAEMKSMISELLQYGISPADLSAAESGTSGETSETVRKDKTAGAGSTGNDAAGAGNTGNRAAGQSAKGGSARLLDLKLHDIRVIYQGFIDYLADRYMTAEEVPDVLSRVADRSKSLKDSVLVLDGFTGFTPIQLKLMRKLLPLAEETYVTVTMDPDENPFGKYRETDLFSMSHEMAVQLARISDETQVKVNPPVILQSHYRFAESGELAFLEKNLFRRRHGVWAEKQAGATGATDIENSVQPETATEDATGEENSAKMEAVKTDAGEAEAVKTEAVKTDAAETYAGIRIFAAANPLEEIEEAARTISRMVRTEGLRYRDFAIITGDLASYGNYVRQVFQKTKIPYFIDEKRFLLHSPFVEYVRAAVEACAEDYSYDSIFRLLRSGMSGIAEEDIDRLENYVLALGIRGKKRWHAKWMFNYKGEDPGEVPEIDAIGKKVCALLDPLANAFSVRGGTVRDKTEALYRFCTGSGCEEKLIKAADDFQESGRPDLALENRQVYPRIMSFLDKLVDVLGNEPISMKDYRAILEAGFSEAKIGIIPPGNDQVLVGDMERSRLSDVRVLIFVGVNEGLVPKAPGSGGVLSEADREKLLAKGIRLKPTPREAISIGRFYIYLALTKPSEKLIISYAVSGSGGEVMRPSYLVSTLTELFPDLKVSHAEEELSERIERPENGILLLTDGFAGLKEKAPSPAWLELFSWYRCRPEYRARTDELLSAAGMRRPKDEIGRSVSEALYGKLLVNSASRLERFSECAFSHFIEYGLKLKEREEFSFSGMDMGNVIHKALELFANKLHDGNMKWADIEPDQRDSLARQCVEEASGTYRAMVLHDTARNEYEITRMQRLMATSVWALQEQLKRGDFVPAEFEADFRDGGLSSVNIDLSGGSRMLLTGRIDRLDTCTADGKTYVKIIDYKTGVMGFDMTAVYYGLQLQLVIYLNAAVEMFGKEGKEVIPAGIFYYQIKDPIEDFEAGETEEELKERILMDMKASGLVADDSEAIHHLDARLSADRPKSDVIPIAYKKDGSLTAASKAVKPEDFTLLSSFVNQKVKEIGEKILNGDAEVNPYEYKQKTACDFCPYRGICGFDRRIPGYRMRSLSAMKDGEALSAMQAYSAGNGYERDIDSPESNKDSAESNTDSAESNTDSAESNKDGAESNTDGAESNTDSPEYSEKSFN